MKMARVIEPYLMLSDSLDKDVQSMFLSLNFMTNILLCPKFSIKNNFIKPNSRLSSFISVISTALFCFLFFFSCFPYMFYSKIQFDSIESFTTLLDSIFYGSGFIMNCILCVIRTNRNVQFVLYFQHLHRCLDDSTGFKRFIKLNWFIFTFILSYYISYYSYLSISMNINFCELLMLHFLILFDLQMVYAMRILKLLGCKASLWNMKVMSCDDYDNVRVKDFCKKMIEAYFCILKCYDIHKGCIQEWVSK